jgi:tetratricopeptide (TPR) repeat protein
MSTALTPKNFWEKPEGRIGKWVLGIGAVGLAVLFVTILPALITLVSNVIYLGVLVGIVLCAGILLTNPSFKAFMGASFQTAMRALISVDPIGVIRQYLEKLERKMAVMAEKRGDLRGSIKQLEGKKSEAIKAMERSLRLAQAAKAKNEEDVLYVESREAARQDAVIKEYDDALKKLVQLDSVIEKMYKAANVVLQDQKNDLVVRERKYEAIKQAYAAFESAKAVLAGNPDERAVYEAGLEEVAEQIGNRLGQIESFLEDSETFLKGIDIENDVFAKTGDDLLNRWIQGGTESIVKPVAAVSYEPGMKLDLGANTTTGSKYLKLTQTVKK